MKIKLGVMDVANGTRTLEYRKWHSMLWRAKCHPHFEPNNVNKFISEEFLLFSNFKEWMNTHDWQGKNLCREIFGMDNYLYSADTCLFVNKEVAATVRFCGHGKTVGCNFDKKLNSWLVRMNTGKKYQYFGRYKTLPEAQAAYHKAKADRLLELANKDTDNLVKRQLFILAKTHKNKSDEYNRG